MMQLSVINNASEAGQLEDWGMPSAMVSVVSGNPTTKGRMLHSGEGGRSDCGIWTAQPGKWNAVMKRDEFFHVLKGRCTVVSESGETTELGPDSIVFFPEGWSGTWEVTETITKVFMLR